MTKAPVSVIIPCFNCSTTIERSFLSVKSQTLVPCEVILIDDASTDNGKTVLAINKMIKEHKEVSNIKLVQLISNSGPSVARNAGWAHSSQPYIAFLDADDIWHPRKIELQLGWMVQHPEIYLFGHGTSLYDENINFDAEELLPPVSIKPFELLWKNPFPTRGVILKKSITRRFPANMRYSEDYYLWADIICGEKKVAFYSKSKLAFSFKNDFGKGGLSQNLKAMEDGELDCIKSICELQRYPGIIKWMASGWSLLKYGRRLIITFLKSNK